MTHFFYGDSVSWTPVEPGIRRKIVGHTTALMSVLVQFDKGAVGTVHSHDVHHQIAYVVQGSFLAEVNGVQQHLKVGDAFVVPARVLHGVTALEQDSVLLDQFSPRRDDYL